MFNNSSYGKVSKFYDLLDSMNYGISSKSREYHLKEFSKVPKNPLIVGCGTGTFTISFLKIINPNQITIVDTEEQMVNLTSSKIEKLKWNGMVHKIVGDAAEIEVRKNYDFISLNYILNIFPPKKRIEFLKNISHLLSENGSIIITDFTRPTNLFLYPIYLINWGLANLVFWIISGNKPNTLGNLKNHILESGLKEVKTKKFLGGLYSSFIFKKIG